MCKLAPDQYLPTLEDTQGFAAVLAPILRAGDTLLLHGQIGAGKTAFARAIIQSRLGSAEDVPSPTFTIVQSYDDGIVEIWHCDLYRLTHPDEVFELGLEEALGTAICLIEWPDRLGEIIPASALNLRFVAAETGHTVSIDGDTSWARRLDNLYA